MGLIKHSTALIEGEDLFADEEVDGDVDDDNDDDVRLSSLTRCSHF